LLQGVSSPGFGRDRRCQFVYIELGIAPGDVGVVDLVGDTEIVEGAEVTAAYSVWNVGLKDEIFLAEAEQVRSVRAVRRCR
jgi:hypothetical protein